METFLNYLYHKYQIQPHIAIRGFSIGFLAIGTGGLLFSAKYDINKRGMLSFLLENFTVAPIKNDKEEIQQYNDKVVYLSGSPYVKYNANDPYFNISIPNVIYLRRVSEMYQSYRSTESCTDSKGKKYTVNVTKYKWSEIEIDETRNSKFPDILKSTNFISTDVELNNFYIHPRLIRDELKNKEVRLNPLEYQKIRPLKSDKNLDFIINNYYFYVIKKSNLDSLGDIRTSFYYLSLNPEGMSVIGMVKDGQVVPITLKENTNWKLFFVTDHIETPVNMIKSTVNRVRNYFYFMFTSSLVLTCLGFYLSDIEKYLKVGNVPNNSVVKINPIRFFNNSIVIGLIFGMTIYFSASFYEKNFIKNKISNLYSYKQIADVQLSHEENESVENEKFMGNKLE